MSTSTPADPLDRIDVPGIILKAWSAHARGDRANEGRYLDLLRRHGVFVYMGPPPTEGGPAR